MSVQDKLFLSKTDCKEICYDINNDLVLIIKSLYTINTKALPMQSRNQIGSTWFKVTARPLLKSSLYVNYEQIGLSGEYIPSEKLNFFVIQYDVDPWPTNFVQSHCTPYDHRDIVSEVWAILDEGQRRYSPNKDS